MSANVASGSPELRLAEPLPQPLAEVLAAGDPARAERVPQPADPPAAEAVVGESPVLGVLEDFAQVLGVEARDQKTLRRSSRPRSPPR